MSIISLSLSDFSRVVEERAFELDNLDIFYRSRSRISRFCKMSKYVFCLRQAVRYIQKTSKTLTKSDISRSCPTTHNICLLCQRNFVNHSSASPIKNNDLKKDEEGHIEELEESFLQSGELGKEIRSANKHRDRENLSKDYKSLEFAESKKSLREKSKYFEKKFLKHTQSIASSDEDLENSESRVSEKFSHKVKKKTKDVASEEQFGLLAQKIIGNTETDKRNPNERIDEALPEDKDEPRDRRLDIPLTREGRIGKTSFFYNMQIAKFGREGKIKEAIAVFEDTMMLRDRVMPSKRTFITLIGILGRVGYTKKAFELYTKMKHLGLDPEDHIYTSLFNACANSPFPAEALRKAQDLLWSLQDRGITPNIFTIKAAMKAFSLCGDFTMAFRLMDKASKWLELDAECFNHLLIASISDKSKGFYRALQVWQKMRDYRVVPNTQTYNLLVRCVRDCGIGDLKEFAVYLGLESPNADIDNTVLLGDGLEKRTDKAEENCQLVVIGESIKKNRISRKEFKSESESLSSTNPKIKSLYANTDKVSSEKLYKKTLTLHAVNETKKEQGINTDFSKSSYLDILTDKKSINSLQVIPQDKVSLSQLKHPEGRLAALGGAGSVLKHMSETGVPPSIQTYTLLLSCTPNNQQSEFQLLAHMEGYGLVPDIDFMNDIMMRRNKRHEWDTVKDLLPIVSKLRLSPNMRTYAALALTCRTNKDAQEFLDTMKAANLEPTAEIMGHLIACSHLNYNYKLSMLMKLEELCLKPTKETIFITESIIAKTKKLIIEAEKNKDDNNFVLSPQFQKNFQKFLRFYKQWLQRTELPTPKHPWKAYEQTKDTESSDASELKKLPESLKV
ncbi:pentatricopeptide repeat-containing protein 1 mitochondrial [Biomphalaria glabrata]|nr:pentatricopeptide repeat-containing protein 1; mitochondrial-like [Biomphalaria glabrata]